MAYESGEVTNIGTSYGGHEDCCELRISYGVKPEKGARDYAPYDNRRTANIPIPKEDAGKYKIGDKVRVVVRKVRADERPAKGRKGSARRSRRISALRGGGY